MIISKEHALKVLYQVGGIIDKRAYPSGLDARTITYLRFDVQQAVVGKYLAFEHDEYIACGNTRSQIERELGLLG